LLRRNRREKQECPESCGVRGGVRLRADIELRDKVPPTKKLSSESWALLDFDGEVDQAQDPLIRQLQVRSILGAHPASSPIHLVADHQDLLIEAEGRPPFGREKSVLGIFSLW
jgi:hypothetical protein